MKKLYILLIISCFNLFSSEYNADIDWKEAFKETRSFYKKPIQTLENDIKANNTKKLNFHLGLVDNLILKEKLSNFDQNVSAQRAQRLQNFINLVQNYKNMDFIDSLKNALIKFASHTDLSQVRRNYISTLKRFFDSEDSFRDEKSKMDLYFMSLKEESLNSSSKRRAVCIDTY